MSLISNAKNNIARSGNGSPEGVLFAPLLTVYRDVVSGFKYLKTTLTGNTGWVNLSAIGGGAPFTKVVEFRIGAVGAPMLVGDTLYQNNALIGVNGVVVFADSGFLHSPAVAPNILNVGHDSVTGQLTFSDPVQDETVITVFKF